MQRGMHVIRRSSQLHSLVKHRHYLAINTPRRLPQGYIHMSLCVRALKAKRLDLSTPNLVHIYSMAGSRHALTLESKGQGHKVIKCAAGVGKKNQFFILAHL